MTQQKSTRDYSLFVANDMNRLVQNSVGYIVRKDLIDSMKNQGYREECPIVCYQEPDGKLRIIDGHNRLAAAMALKIEVQYIAYKANGAGEFTPVQFSRTQRKWSMDQCAKAYAHAGNTEYVDLLDYCKTYAIRVNQAASMLGGQLAASGNISAAVLDGTFQIKDRVTAEAVGRVVLALNENFPSKAPIPSGLVSAVSRCIYAEGFDPNLMIEKIEKYPDLIERKRTVDQYMDMLDMIYNRNFKGQRFPLKFRADEAARMRNVAFRKKHGRKR